MLRLLTLPQVLGNLVGTNAVVPFVGNLSDLLGRRYLALLGGCFLVIGMIVTSTAHTMNNAIGSCASSTPRSSR